jgi:hypothetical protein
MMTSFMIDVPFVCNQFRAAERLDGPGPLPIVMCEFLFSGKPVIDIMAIAPAPRVIEVVRQASDLVSRWALAAARVFAHSALTREGRCDIGARHMVTS